MAPDDDFRPYSETKNLNRNELCGYDKSCNYEEFLNKKYGMGNWQYDENFFIKYPEIAETLAIVPITTGTKEATLAKTFTEITIYIEDHIRVINRDEYHAKCVSANKLAHDEMQILQIAKFKFDENTFLFISTGLKVVTDVGYRANLFAVFTNENKDLIRIAKPPHSIATEICIAKYFIKDVK